MVAVIRLVPIDEIAPRRAEAGYVGASECLVLGGVQRHRRCIVNPPAQRVRRDTGWGRAQPVHVVAPALAVSRLPVREASRKRPLRRSEGRRRVAAIAERDGERRIPANAADLAALDNIAVAGVVETADEGPVLVQFDIAVARHRCVAVVIRNEDVGTSDLERRNDRRGRAEQGSCPACHER